MFNPPTPTFNEHPVLFSELPDIHTKKWWGIILKRLPYRRFCKKISVTVTPNVLFLCTLGVTLVWPVSLLY